jgi:YfiH family protein
MSIDRASGPWRCPEAPPGAWRHTGHLVWWEAALPGAVVHFSTRRIGASAPPYDTLNLGLHVGDDPERVRANRHGFRAAALADRALPVVGEQVHGTSVAVVDAGDAGRGWDRQEDALPATDALVTRAADLPLAVLVADCAPVAFVAAGGVVAAAHAGWRGLAEGILEATLEKMAAGAGTGAPGSITAVVGPCIRACCYEVGEEVWRRFPESCLAPASRPEARRLDLLAAVIDRLEGAGVSRERVHASSLCTSCLSDLFFSHRRATGEGHPATGRMALFVTRLYSSTRQRTSNPSRSPSAARSRSTRPASNPSSFKYSSVSAVR